MAYTINRYNGTVLTSVEDGTINQTTEIKFVGKNYSGYGEIQNENFLHLLENFANNSPPNKAISGQLWYDSSISKLKFYDGVKWRAAGSTEVSNSDPVGLVEGDLWYKPSTKQIFVKTSDNNFVLVGPQVAGVDVTQLISDSVVDTQAISQPIIKATVNGQVVFVVSNTEFIIGGADTIPGFDKIRRGITLVNTQAITDGITTNSGNPNEPVIWGTASNALKLDGKTSSDFVLSSGGNFTDIITTPSDGVLIDNILQIYVDSTSDIGIIENTAGNTIQFNITEGSTLKNIFKTTTTGITPNVTNTYNIGASNFAWNTVYATNFVGTATSATSLIVSGAALPGSTAAVRNTIVARDANADIYANDFHGTAIFTTGSVLPRANSNFNGTDSGQPLGGNSYRWSELYVRRVNALEFGSIFPIPGAPSSNNDIGSASNRWDTVHATTFNGASFNAIYADLAEKYTTDKEYLVGTVMQVSSHPDHETEACKLGGIAIGVVSENPAYLMNSQSPGQALALKGRVPVRVIGAVKKGEAIFAWKDGTASTTGTSNMVGVALESNADESEKLVECVLKV